VLRLLFSVLTPWRADSAVPDSPHVTKLRAYAELGIDAFILSGYPHATECDLFARHVLPRMRHARLAVQPAE